MLLSRIETKSPYPLQHFIEHLPGHHHLGKLEHKPPRMTHQSPAYLDESRLNTCQGPALYRFWQSQPSEEWLKSRRNGAERRTYAEGS